MFFLAPTFNNKQCTTMYSVVLKILLLISLILTVQKAVLGMIFTDCATRERHWSPEAVHPFRMRTWLGHN